jgi:hypothetical protein
MGQKMGHGRGTRAQGNVLERLYITTSFRDIVFYIDITFSESSNSVSKIQDGYLVNQLFRTLLYHIVDVRSTKFFFDLRGALVERLV